MDFFEIINCFFLGHVYQATTFSSVSFLYFFVTLGTFLWYPAGGTQVQWPHTESRSVCFNAHDEAPYNSLSLKISDGDSYVPCFNTVGVVCLLFLSSSYVKEDVTGGEIFEISHN